MPSNHWWFSQKQTIPVSPGIIVPFNDVAANIPSGWTQFTANAGRAFTHTSTLAEIGTTGGNTYVTRTTGSGGNHTGSGTSYWLAPSSGSCVADYVGAWQGNHAHSCRVNFYPNRRWQVMMKATQEQSMFPANTGMLSDVDQTSNGLSEITPNGYGLYGTAGASSVNYGAGASLSNFSTAGNHNHLAGCGPTGSSGGAYATLYNQGGHSTHSGTPSVTDNLFRTYLSMWTNASSEFAAAPGMYALYESLTIPDGWAICDGSSGTPNLTNRMIGLSTNSSLWGTSDGNGTITTSASLGSAGSHHHNNGYGTRNTASTGYHINAVSHTHTIGAAASGFYPQWYKLVIIKLIG